MENYLKKVINKFPDDIKGTASTPTKENLFKVRDIDTRKLLHGT